MPENFANRYQVALGSTVTAGAVTGTVTSATGAPDTPFRAIISAEGGHTDEIVLVTNRVGTTLTWTRAAEAIAGVQVASAHTSGATFTAILTAVGLLNVAGPNVKGYGALGDGSTDDTAAFHAAIAAGHDVFVPAGTYRVNIAETAIADLRLHGEGAASILQPFDLTKPAIKMTGSVTDLEIDHLAIDGRHDDGAVQPVFLQDMTWVSIHDCAFSDAAFRAINISNNAPGGDAYPPLKTRVWIERNTFVDNELDAIFLGNVGEFWVRGNLIETAGDTAIDGGQGGENGVISENIIRGAQTGIYMSDFTGRMVISGNVLTGVTGNGIHVQSGSYGAVGYTISDNIVVGTGGGTTGIHSGGIIGNTEGVAGLIVGNWIEACSFAAMMVNQNSDGTIIAANVLHSPPGAALRLYSAGVKIVGNDFGGGAIVLTGAGVGTVADALGDGAFDATNPLSEAIGESSATGSAAYAARRDHKHGMPAFGVAAANIGTSAAGSFVSVAHADHVHGTGAGTPSTQAFGDAAATGTGPAAAMTDHKHAMPANPVRSQSSTTPAAVGTAAVGTGSTDARSDHVHATGAGTPSTQAVGDAAAVGTGPAAAMTDHKHAMPAFGTGPAAVGTQANGSSANIARIDHVHATGAGTPSTQAFGDAAATGTGPAAAMTDHKHAMPTGPINVFIGPFAPGLGNSNAVGTANTAYLAAFQVLAAQTVTKMAFRVAAQSGNVDVGVYSSDGTTLTKLRTSGSVGCPGVAVRQTVNLSSSLALVPGVRYFLAFAADNGTASIGRASGTVGGFDPTQSGGSIATSFPLPLSITAANISGDTMPMAWLE